MPKKKSQEDNLHEFKTRLRASVLYWFLGFYELPTKQRRIPFVVDKIEDGSINFYRVVDVEKKILRLWSNEDIELYLIQVSITECASHMFAILGEEGHFTPRIANTVRMQALALLAYPSEAYDVQPLFGHTIAAIQDEREEKDYCFTRLPVCFDPQIFVQIATECGREPLQAFEDHCGTFLHSLKIHMADYNPRKNTSRMFDILQCFYARMFTEAKSSAEFVYWLGEGGDGKGTLNMFTAKKLEHQAIAIGYETFCRPFSAGTFAHKRFVCVEEVNKGNFFTDRVKEFTGNDLITVEKKGKNIQQIRNRMILMFTSNHKPSFDGTRAQSRRLRLVYSLALTIAKRTPQELEDELESVWPTWIQYCIHTYQRYGCQIPENEGDYLEELQESYHADTDGWIEDWLEHCPGAFIPISTLKNMTRGSNVSHTQIENRLKILVSKPVDVEEMPRKTRKRMPGKNPVFGLLNVRPHRSKTHLASVEANWLRP